MIAENREDCSFIWENYYDAEGQINEYDLTIFARTENQDGEDIFRRFTETHYQRGYTLEVMRGMVEKAGMEFVRAEDADTHGEVREESERIYVIARECGKDRKMKKQGLYGKSDRCGCADTGFCRDDKKSCGRNEKPS